jgi:hypothetical protein
MKYAVFVLAINSSSIAVKMLRFLVVEVFELGADVMFFSEINRKIFVSGLGVFPNPRIIFAGCFHIGAPGLI